MKRTIAANSFAIALATVLILGIAPQAQAGDGKGCSNSSLTGTFGYTATGFLVAPPQSAAPSRVSVRRPSTGMAVPRQLRP